MNRGIGREDISMAAPRMFRGSRSLCRIAILAGLAVLPAAVANAHPHVFVTAKEELIFSPGGLVIAVRHTWKFDDMYSAFITQGLGQPGQVLTKEQLAPLAKTNVESLAEFKFFTVVKAAGKEGEFDAPTDYWNEQGSDKLVTLHFTLPLKTPASASRVLTLLVYDPTYFVAFTLDDKNPISMVSAPNGCSSSISKPQPLDVKDNQKLSESFFTNMSPGSDFGVKLAERAIVACP